MEEEQGPIPESPADYLYAAGNSIENYEQTKLLDDITYGKALETFRNKSRLIATVLIATVIKRKRYNLVI